MTCSGKCKSTPEAFNMPPGQCEIYTKALNSGTTLLLARSLNLSKDAEQLANGRE